MTPGFFPGPYPQVLGAEPTFLGLIVVVGPVDHVDNHCCCR